MLLPHTSSPVLEAITAAEANAFGRQAQGSPLDAIAVMEVKHAARSRACSTNALRASHATAEFGGPIV